MRDNNTKYFHNYENMRRKDNYIWDILNHQSMSFFTTVDIQGEVVHYFKEIFCQRQGLFVVDQIWGIVEYPQMFDVDTNAHM